MFGINRTVSQYFYHSTSHMQLRRMASETTMLNREILAMSQCQTKHPVMQSVFIFHNFFAEKTLLLV